MSKPKLTKVPVVDKNGVKTHRYKNLNKTNPAAATPTSQGSQPAPAQQTANTQTEPDTAAQYDAYKTKEKYPRDYSIIVDRSNVTTPEDPYSPHAWLKTHPDLDVKTNEWLGDEQRIAEEKARVAKWGGSARKMQGVTLGQYQGEYVFVVEHKPTGKYAVVVAGYGSCSYCDAWQAAEEKDGRFGYNPGVEPKTAAAEMLADQLYTSVKLYEPEILLKKLEEETSDPAAAENPEWYNYETDYEVYTKTVIIPALRKHLDNQT